MRELVYPGESYTIKNEKGEFVLFDDSTKEQVAGFKPQLVAVNGML